MSTSTYRLLNLLLLAALFAGSLIVYPRLPQRLPIHFGMNGQPNAWQSRSLLLWLMLPLIAAGVALLLEVASRTSASHPHLWNVPDKPRFMALTPDERAPIIHHLRHSVAVVGVMTTALLCQVQAAVYHAATGAGPGLHAYALAAADVNLVVLLVTALRLNARVATLIRDAYGRRAAASLHGA